MSNLQSVTVPDIGGAQEVDIIEILVKPGDQVAIDDALITLEGDKATMEIPSPYAGKIKQVMVKVGDKVSQASLILTLISETSEKTAKANPSIPAKPLEETASPSSTTEQTTDPDFPVVHSSTSGSAITQPENTATQAPASPHNSKEEDMKLKQVHAGPAVRRLARELGVDLHLLTGSGPKKRILKTDIQQFVKTELKCVANKIASATPTVPMPAIDYSQFGEIETKPLNRIKKLTGLNLQRSWSTVPHVTQFGQADITELEAFRTQQNNSNKQGIKLTPLVFIMKAVVDTLRTYPSFNASLDPTGEQLILKKYLNIGVAVDTPNGLVVPVIRDVDKKGLTDLAQELSQISAKARAKGLSITDMQGGCFTISSLGGIGGTAFTPIVNTPEVAILGVSKASLQPVYHQGNFIPKLLLPLSLSYDHRVIDGAEGARFMVHLTERLSDIRCLLL